MQPSHFRSFFAGFVWHPAIVSDVLQIGRSPRSLIRHGQIAQTPDRLLFKRVFTFKPAEGLPEGFQRIRYYGFLAQPPPRAEVGAVSSTSCHATARGDG
jgi:hypothetical protein